MKWSEPIWKKNYLCSNTRNTIKIIVTADIFYYCLFYVIFSDKYLMFDDFYLYKILIILYSKQIKVTKYYVFFPKNHRKHCVLLKCIWQENSGTPTVTVYKLSW